MNQNQDSLDLLLPRPPILLGSRSSSSDPTLVIYTWMFSPSAIRDHFSPSKLPPFFLTSPNSTTIPLLPNQFGDVNCRCHIDSPSFGSTEDKTYFVLKLYPTGGPGGPSQGKDKGGQLDSGSLFLALADSQEDEVKVRVTMVVANWLTGEPEVCKIEGNLGKNLNGEEQMLGWSGRFNWLDHIVNPNGRTNEKFSIKALITYTKIPDRPLKKLSTDLSSLFAHPRFTDVILVAEGEEFPVHRAILSARSPVFEAMFERFGEKSLENVQRKVDISDIRSEVMKLMLEHIYSGRTEEIEEYVGELLEAADKYDIQSLQRVCIHHMLTSMTTDNAAQFFVLAELHSLATVKEATTQFISLHVDEVQSSDGWQVYVQPNLHLFGSDAVKLLPVED